MRILLFIHAAPPLHWAGAETMIWEFGQEMIRRGHEVKCIARGQKEFIYQGVEMMPTPPHVNSKRRLDHHITRLKEKRDKWFRWADIVWTHLGFAGEAKQLCEKHKKPLIHLIHNTAKITPAYNGRVNQGFIFNSEAMYNAHLKHGYLTTKGLARPYAIVRPTIDPKKYKTTKKGDCYTLINLNENKGGAHFLRLARKLKNRQFLAVQGMYGHQVIAYHDGLMAMNIYNKGEGDLYLDLQNNVLEKGDIKKLYDYIPDQNIQYQPNTGDMVSVYNRTRMLLIMSLQETWGRTASEAMCNGIPVIYHHPKDGTPTDGLHEHVQNGGLRVKERDNIQAWIDAIKEVESNYDEYSQKALARFEQLGHDFGALEELNRYVVNWSPRTRTIRL